MVTATVNNDHLSTLQNIFKLYDLNSKIEMRSLLPIGFLVLYVVTFTNAQGDKIVFRDEGNEDVVADDREWAIGRYHGFAHRAVTRSANSFGLRCFKQVGNGNAGNLIFSPISTSLMLSMMSYGANNAAREEIRNVLESSKNPTLAAIGYRMLVDQMDAYKAANVELLNAVFLDYSVTPKSEFVETLHSVFHPALYTTNMTNPSTASNNVNNWSEANTRNRIKDIVGPDNFGSGQKLLLLNVVSFKGTWLKAFDPQITRFRDFFLNDNDGVQVPIMSVTGMFRHGALPNLDSKFVELPYKSVDGANNFSMFVILPNKRNGLADLEANLAEIKVEDLVQNGRVGEIDIYLPKFKIESKFELAKPLADMGIKKVFDQGSLSEGFLERDLGNIKFIQKAVIEVNELGNENAANNGIFFGVLKTNLLFNANHPFLAIIATTGQNPVALFTLRYTGRE